MRRGYVWPGSMTDKVRKGEVSCCECGRVFTNTRQYSYGIRDGEIVRICRGHARSDKPWEGE